MCHFVRKYNERLGVIMNTKRSLYFVRSAIGSVRGGVRVRACLSALSALGYTFFFYLRVANRRSPSKYCRYWYPIGKDPSTGSSVWR